MSKQTQNYVRLNVELKVNGVSCPISGEALQALLEEVARNSSFRYRYRSHKRFIGVEPDILELTAEVMSEIIKSPQTEIRSAIAGYGFISKELVGELLFDDQIEVLRQLTQNECALSHLTKSEVFELAERTADYQVIRNIAEAVFNDDELGKGLREHSKLMELLMKHPDSEVRMKVADYFVEQRVKAEEHNDILDATMLSAINNITDARLKQQQERKGNK